MTDDAVDWLRATRPLLLVMMVACVLAACAQSVAPAPPPAATVENEGVAGRALDGMLSQPFDSNEWVEWAEQFGALRFVSTRTNPLCVTDPTNTTSHDGQRMIVVNSGRRAYGPLVAILVDPARVEVTDFSDGRYIACLLNQGDFSFAPLEYTTLGIPPGYSCLWLQGVDGQHPWTAEIRPVITGTNECSTTAAATLEAHPITIENGPDEYPSTARWMWDDRNEAQFIGMRCGNAWCEMGPPGFNRTPLIATRYDVPGLWDEQYLSYESGGQLVVSEIWGTFSPGPELGDVAGPTPPLNVPLLAAYVRLSNPQNSPAAQAQRARYRTKLGLRASGVGPLPVLYMKTNSTIGAGWLSKPDVHPAWSPRVSFFNHLHATGNAVRWAWSDEDEGFWVSCENGCCKMMET